MKYKMVVWHLNSDLATAHGYAKRSADNDVFMDAVLGFGDKGKRAAQQLWEVRSYLPVAVVTYHSDSMDAALEHAFEVTNSIDTAWDAVRGPSTVVPLRSQGNRSTSVGDAVQVVAIDDKRVDEKVYLVSPMGFKPM